MSFMENIRSKGQYLLLGFLVVFVITLFFGLTGGFNPVAPRGARQADSQPKSSGRVIAEGPLADAPLLVNGQAVPDEVFDDIVRRFDEMLNRQGRDPSQTLMAYGFAVNALAEQEAKLQEARKRGIKVTDADLAKAKKDASTQFLAAETKGTGNVVGDLMKQYNDAKALKVAFAQYLEIEGLSEAQWEAQVKRELLANKLDEEIKAKLEGEEKAELDKRKAEVDAELAKGTSFAAVSDKFNDDKANSGEGGDMGWIGYGLLQDEKQRDAVFATDKGKVTDWIDLEAGWMKCEVYDKKDEKDPDFEKNKTQIRQYLIDQHKQDPNYKPTDEDIANQYKEVAIRQIMLRKTAGEKVAKETDRIAKAAVVEVNNAYSLAYQALNGDKLLPPSSLSYEKLVELAKSCKAAGASYDFSPIKGKIENGKPKAEEAQADVEKKADDQTESQSGAAEDEAAEDGAAPSTSEDSAEAAPADGDTDAAAAEGDSAATDTGTASTEPETVSMGTPIVDAAAPMYALGIALLEKALADDDGAGASFARYLIAKTYIDWMADTDRLKTQPIDRDLARQAIEENLAEAAKRDEYNAELHALRGLNLAWLQKKDEAYASLDLAMKYVSADDTETWDKIKESYEVFDDKAKLDVVDKKLADIRQEKFQKQIEQAMREAQKKDEAEAGGTPAPAPTPGQ